MDDWTKEQERQYAESVVSERNMQREDKAIDMLHRHVPVKALIFEFGCGGGDLTMRLQSEGRTVVGFDLPMIVEGCRNRFPAYSGCFQPFDLDHIDDFIFNVNYDDMKDPDVVIALEVVEHLINDIGFLRGCCKIGAEYLILCVPLRDDLTATNHHLRYYPRSSMEKLLRIAGYEVLEYAEDGNSKYFAARRK